jgi:DNA-binding LacI/PurR family transcriptional regulator
MLRYEPNLNGRRLALRRAQSIALVQGRNIGTVFGDAFFRVVVEGISTVAQARGYSLLFSPTAPANATGVRVEHPHLGNGAVDGALILGAVDEVLLLRVRDRGLPCILIDTYLPGIDVPAVYPDYRAAACMGTGHLLDLGHQRIAFLGGAVSYPFGHDTLEGYRDALGARGLVADPVLIHRTEINVDAARRATHALLELSAPPTALFAATDAMALGALRAARERGLAVPRRLAIVGMDDIELSAYTEPPLTTVRIPKGEMGGLAANRLIAMIEGESVPRDVNSVSGELIVRGSCGKLGQPEVGPSIAP